MFPDTTSNTAVKGVIKEESPEWGMMYSLLQVPVKSAVFGRFCFARAYRDRSETYRQMNINSKHTVHSYISPQGQVIYLFLEGLDRNQCRALYVQANEPPYIYVN